jgi:hypothetical protein
MSLRKRVLSPKLIPVLALLTLTIPAAVCQLNSNTASVALNATLGEPRNQFGKPTPATRRYLYGHAEYTGASSLISAQGMRNDCMPSSRVQFHDPHSSAPNFALLIGMNLPE